jgi:hypothetical protein
MKGQASAVAFMIAIVILICALAFAPVVNEITKKAMNDTDADLGEVGGMDCTNTTISDFQKGACWTMDITQSYFIIGLIALGGVVIAARILW